MNRYANNRVAHSYTSWVLLALLCLVVLLSGCATKEVVVTKYVTVPVHLDVKEPPKLPSLREILALTPDQVVAKSNELHLQNRSYAEYCYAQVSANNAQADKAQQATTDAEQK